MPHSLIDMPHSLIDMPHTVNVLLLFLGHQQLFGIPTGVTSPQDQAAAAAAVGAPFAQQVGATPEEDKVPLAVMAAAGITPLRPQVCLGHMGYMWLLSDCPSISQYCLGHVAYLWLLSDPSISQ